MSDHHQDPDDLGFFEKPGTIRMMWIVLIALCVVVAALGVAGMILHWMHPYFTLDALPVFYALVGAVAATVIGAGGRLLSQMLTMAPDYYDSDADLRHPQDGNAEGGHD
ncbi:hypothetical protein FF098_016775 [Parvularcula flava]|uniref:Uncharacterized protein n=1 Tax=Aquisalinus luteolus TaxID=1566827 RepID=A0A8J3A6S4_9PROT|nr:hypothetical protein [Aquisalinus luteolus]NHK29564.1 hypothetical protein [Aquisalinus luteolus]GGI01563.1 hypothetical protein GCM10011355_32510 [Aquisalinus luteolus]